MKDYFSILNVNRNATKEEIKAAYRKLAKQYHPDVNKSPDAEEKFKEITEAYNALIDNNNSDNGFSFSWNIEEMFNNFRYQHNKQVKKHINIMLNLTLEESLKGCTKKVKYVIEKVCPECLGSQTEKGKDNEVCPECMGTGMKKTIKQTNNSQIIFSTNCHKCLGKGYIITHPCTNCKGEGFEKEEVTKDVEVPVGINNDNMIILNVEKDIILNIFVKVEEHPYIKRKGNDLFIKVKVPFTSLITGDIIKINNLIEDIEVKIPECYPNDKPIMIKNKGIKGGDLYVILIAEYPLVLDEQLRASINKIKEHLKFTEGKFNYAKG